MAYLWRACIALILLAAIVATPAYGQNTEPIRVVSSEARPDFPTTIDFSLVAEATDADIASVQLLYGATRAEALSIVDLDVTPGRRVELRHTVDMQVYYAPPGTDMTFRWVIRDAAGAQFESEPQSFVYHDERFGWSERSERNVTVYWYEGDAAFGDELIATTTRTLDRLQAQIGAELPLPVRIYVYANNADMRSALQANEVEWVGGQANPTIGIIIGAIAPGDSSEVERLIPHELSHQVFHQAVDNPYGGTPLWFDEGLAVHNQEVRDRDFDEMVADAARANRLVPLEALASSFPADPDQALLSYAQSRDMVEHIINTYGEEKLRELVRAFAVATPTEAALQSVLGRGVDELDAEWQATLPPSTEPAPVLAGPQVAPDDRFDEPPVLPSGVQPAVPAPNQPFEDQQPRWVTWVNGLPVWATISAAAFCCIAGVIALGAALLIGLRLVGVDKRTG